MVFQARSDGHGVLHKDKERPVSRGQDMQARRGTRGLCDGGSVRQQG